MSYKIKADILLRINEGDHPNALWSEDFELEGEPEVVDGIKTHMVATSDVIHALFCAIQEKLDEGKGEKGDDVDRGYAVTCAEHIIKHYSKEKA